ncbi:MAG: NAD(+) synthase [Flavobacteriales bacterium]|tara:strand:- start:12852 stop:13631 length:780 start_codon:yes stop_codon:yes gene_type:complete
MKTKIIIEFIVNWLDEYASKAGMDGFVLGISGGIDSAVTSTLCAMTRKKIICLNLPIHQTPSQLDRSNHHIAWLKEKFEGVSSDVVDLTATFDQTCSDFPEVIQDQLTMANVRARLRMTTLYAFAGHHKYLVAGTGNKVEDFGVGFFTKYGDGGVDLSPIADLMKTQVFEIAAELNIIEEIQQAKPTDGLWGDDRTDEDQIGASYPELEWAMNYIEQNETNELSERQKKVMSIYKSLNKANQHKMVAIPVCDIPKEYFN